MRDAAAFRMSAQFSPRTVSGREAYAEPGTRAGSGTYRLSIKHWPGRAGPRWEDIAPPP
ncbi:hypothetical protein AGR3A_Cc280068 [Agrobacterium tomkonis CFBP 6623]|uniref:Uncharacterized protein n=1 Tax=Agrobacterium tomkonis CFBP 6623 TaxID=1183432 RepID=A0A1S7PPU8_9HYPH|nr:hypothetical protein AGR3A_Cc280068 [Agrobacterium tomkonis CFBP 6623]